MSYSRTLSYAVAFATCLLFTDIANAQLNVGKSIRGIVGKVIATPGNIMPSAPTRSTCPNMNRPPTTVRPPVATQPPVYVQPPRYVQPPVYTQPQPVYSQPQPAMSQSVYVSPPVASAPVRVAPTPAAKPKNNKAEKAKAKQLANQAKQHFRTGQYGKAKSALDQIVKLVPKDASGWQFRGLVNFAMGDFDEAAADMYDAMKLGKVWPRRSVDALYGKHAADYASQLEKLDDIVASDPSMQGHFLLAYHHTVNDQLEEAKQDLQSVLKLQPNEPLSTQLLASLEQRLAQK